MKRNLIVGAPLAIVLLIISIGILGGGCGGGTRGSGGQLFEGVVFDSESRTLAGVSITILSTGDSAISAADGSFSIETAGVTERVEFLLESQEFSAQTPARVVPANARRVFVRLVVGPGNTPSVDVDIDVVENKPQPTARPSATRPPHAGTPIPATTPGQVPSPAPTRDDGDNDDDDEDEDDNSDDDSDDDSPGSSGSTGASDGQGDDSDGDSIDDDDDAGDDDNNDDDDDSNDGDDDDDKK